MISGDNVEVPTMTAARQPMRASPRDRVHLSAVAFDAGEARLAGRRLYMCRHEGTPRPLEQIASSHDLDVALQDKYDLRWLTYYVNEETGTSFCLADAPSRDAVEACHREAHGPMMGYRVIEVDRGMIEAYLGAVLTPAPGFRWSESPLRILLVAEIATDMATMLRRGDVVARSAQREFERIVSECLAAGRGREVQRASGRIMASFPSAARAVHTALAIQHEMGTYEAKHAGRLDVRIGLNAGEPLSDEAGLFGAAVELASKVAAAAPPGTVLVSDVVRSLSAGAGWTFRERDALEVDGLGRIGLYEVLAPPDEPATPHSTYPDGLTSREVDVLKLLANGQTNQQIAATLVISPNTVARHVAHILNKTNAANRTEAAAYAFREQLL